MSEDRDLRILRDLAEREPGDPSTTPRDDDPPVDPALESRLVKSAMGSWRRRRARALADHLARILGAEPLVDMLTALAIGACLVVVVLLCLSIMHDMRLPGDR